MQPLSNHVSCRLKSFNALAERFIGNAIDFDVRFLPDFLNSAGVTNASLSIRVINFLTLHLWTPIASSWNDSSKRHGAPSPISNLLAKSQGIYCQKLQVYTIHLCVLDELKLSQIIFRRPRSPTEQAYAVHPGVAAYLKSRQRGAQARRDCGASRCSAFDADHKSAHQTKSR
ncbi:hypothetical protein THH46_18400 [Pseudomonas sp. NA13]